MTIYPGRTGKDGEQGGENKGGLNIDTILGRSLAISQNIKALDDEEESEAEEEEEESDTAAHSDKVYIVFYMYTVGT